MQGFLELASLSEHPGNVPMATGMVDILLENHEQVVRNMHDHIDLCSESFHDQGTADFLTGLMEQHVQIAWILRSFIEGEAVLASGSGSDLTNQSKVGV
jgi:starvation-inducible DNA-binding protein